MYSSIKIKKKKMFQSMMTNNFPNLIRDIDTFKKMNQF